MADDTSGPRGRVLIIAGSDSGGGAGIQADIKTVTALGGYAATAVTAVTVQNTLGVTGVHPIPVDIIEAQIEAVLSDIGADAVKTGMLAALEVAAVAAKALKQRPGLPAVIDPVMVAATGARLISEAAAEAIKVQLLPLAAVITPNVPEAEALTGLKVEDVEGQRAAGEALLGLGARAALVKGGHLDGDQAIDVLVTSSGARIFARPRIETRNTHGTGCTLASAIAAHLAQGRDLVRAVEAAGDYLHEAIARAPGLGAGKGPVDHGWPLKDAAASRPNGR